jgi:hypothetical protein
MTEPVNVCGHRTRKKGQLPLHRECPYQIVLTTVTRAVRGLEGRNRESVA